MIIYVHLTLFSSPLDLFFKKILTLRITRFQHSGSMFASFLICFIICVEAT